MPAPEVEMMQPLDNPHKLEKIPVPCPILGNQTQHRRHQQQRQRHLLDRLYLHLQVLSCYNLDFHLQI